MERLEMHTEAIKATGEELKKIANDYNTLINEMYTKIEELPNSDFWKSEELKGSTDKFVEKAKGDKEKTLEVGKKLNSIGEEVINYAESINNTSEIIL